MGAWDGDSWLGCRDLSAIRAAFYLGGWLATVEAPRYPRLPFHLSKAVG